MLRHCEFRPAFGWLVVHCYILWDSINESDNKLKYFVFKWIYCVLRKNTFKFFINRAHREQFYLYFASVFVIRFVEKVPCIWSFNNLKKIKYFKSTSPFGFQLASEYFTALTNTLLWNFLLVRNNFWCENPKQVQSFVSLCKSSLEINQSWMWRTA